MANRIQDLIDRAARGEAVPGLIMWMQQTGEDSDELPLHWRHRDVSAECPHNTEESGALYARGWARALEAADYPHEAEEIDLSACDDTYSVAAYFSGPDGLYIGPDRYGVYPCLVAE
jgi:hypothetical protein